MSDTLIQEQKKMKFPTEIVHLPSKGLVYDEGNSLSSGKVEIKHMTAKEEDILTTESYITSGVVIDKLLQSLIVDPSVLKVYDTLINGDKNALLIAARKYGYGQNYEFEVDTPSGQKQKVSIDLDELAEKEIDESLFKNENKFTFTLPKSGSTVTFKLLTVGDEKQITERLKKTKVIGKSDKQLTVRLAQMITEVDGNVDATYIRLFVEEMIAMDSKAFRQYINEIQPNINMEIEIVDEATGKPFRSNVTFGASFFWPEL